MPLLQCRKSARIRLWVCFAGTPQIPAGWFCGPYSEPGVASSEAPPPAGYRPQRCPVTRSRVTADPIPLISITLARFDDRCQHLSGFNNDYRSGAGR